MISKSCPRCRRQIPEPPTNPTSNYAKFWRDNRCYVCDSLLGSIQPQLPRGDEVLQARVSPRPTPEAGLPESKETPASEAIKDSPSATVNKNSANTGAPTPVPSTSRSSVAVTNNRSKEVTDAQLGQPSALLAVVHVVLQLLAMVSAGAVGNGLTAAHIPSLHNATWLTSKVMKILTAPDTLVDWLFGALPKTIVPLVLFVCLAAGVILIHFSNLPNRFRDKASTRKDQRNVSDNPERQLLRGQDKAQLKWRMTGRFLALSLYTFCLGVSAGAVAWGMARLINRNAGGVVQTAALALGVFVLLGFNSLLSEFVPEMIQDSDSE